MAWWFVVRASNVQGPLKLAPIERRRILKLALTAEAGRDHDDVLPLLISASRGVYDSLTSVAHSGKIDVRGLHGP